MGGKAISFKIALAPETAMYVLIDITILIHHREAWSRLVKKAGFQLNHCSFSHCSVHCVRKKYR